MQYGTFGAVVIFGTGLYLAIKGVKYFIEFQKKSGKTYDYLLNPFNSSKLKSEIGLNEELTNAFREYKSKVIRLFYIWVTTILFFMTGAFIIGYYTSSH
jgi:hypothetical protein